jgi:hypothetical protein
MNLAIVMRYAIRMHHRTLLLLLVSTAMWLMSPSYISQAQQSHSSQSADSFDAPIANDVAKQLGITGTISIADNFQRANTIPGTLGNTLTGQRWTVFGRGFVTPPCCGSPYSGQILNNRVIANGGWFYAVAYSASPLTRIGGTFSYNASTGTTENEEFVLAILPSLPPSVATISMTVHIELARTGYAVSYFVKGTSTVVGAGSWSSPLATDGTVYKVDANIYGDTLVFNVPKPIGTSGAPQLIILTSPAFAAAASDHYMFFEQTVCGHSCIDSYYPATYGIWAGTATSTGVPAAAK